MRNSFPTYHHFSTRFSTEGWESSSHHPTECLTCSSPTLTDINIAYGYGMAVKWLMAHLAVIQERINVPNKMSAYEVETCAQNIFDFFHHLKASELMLFFARLVGGAYPVDWHGYITPTKITTALREHYIPWRNNLLYRIEEREKDRQKKEDNRTPTMSWDEYCHAKGIDKPNPFENIT